MNSAYAELAENAMEMQRKLTLIIYKLTKSRIRLCYNFQYDKFHFRKMHTGKIVKKYFLIFHAFVLFC